MTDLSPELPQLSIYELNTAPENLTRMSLRDSKIMIRLTYYAQEIKSERLNFQQALKAFLNEFKPEDPNEDNPITQWVKPPLLCMAARTDRDLYWVPKSGEPQTLKAGGYIMLSYKKLKGTWDIWGVANDAIKSYALDVAPSKEIPEYMDLYGKYIDLSILPKMDVQYSLGEKVSGIQPTTFCFAVKAAPAIVFFAQSDFDMWGLESTEPYKVTKGTPVLIGVLFETWTRKIEDFKEAYLRVDQYAVKHGQLLKLFQKLLAEGVDIPENLRNEVFTMFQRLSLFSMSSDNNLITTDMYLKFQTATSKIPVVKIENSDNT